jgi:nuclear transcription Y subunit beta
LYKYTEKILYQNIKMTDECQDIEAREQDRFLPIANISRIMKKALPPNAKISKDAKECVQECVSEFISFITSEACEKCLSERRKTINGDDLLHAMTTLGFEKYIDPLRIYLQRYREVTKTDKPEEGLMPSSTVPDIKVKDNDSEEDDVDDD